MKRFLKSKLVLPIAAFIMIVSAILIPLSGSITHSFAASRSSHNIAYVNYDDSGFTGNVIPSANIFTDSVVGGPAPTSAPTDSVTYNGMTFTPLAKSAISTSSLAPFDTLILFEVCDIATSLSAAQHAAINAFLAAGNKILLYDADRCAPSTAGGGAAGNADYSWFTFPFATSNPGPQGASGNLTIVEQSTLTTGPNILANDPFNLDELGDANTATTSNPNWFAAAKTTNFLNNNGFFLAYARNSGLIIYDGADRWYTDGPTQSLTDLFVNELDQQYNPDNLPSTVPIASPTPTLSPSPTPPPSVSFTKAATSPVPAGGTVDYTLTLTNTSPIGSVELHNINLNDALPGGLDAITAGPAPTISPTGAALVSCKKSGLTVSCTIDNFVPGGKVAIKFSAKVDAKARGTITNTSKAQSLTLGILSATAKTTVTTPTPTPAPVPTPIPTQASNCKAHHTVPQTCAKQISKDTGEDLGVDLVERLHGVGVGLACLVAIRAVAPLYIAMLAVMVYDTNCTDTLSDGVVQGYYMVLCIFNPICRNQLIHNPLGL